MNSGPFWTMLGDKERESWLDVAAATIYAPGERVCEEGKQAAFVAVIYAGWVMITSRQNDGRETAIALRSVGDLIGESASTGRPCTASVIALVKVRAWLITAEHFADFLQSHERVDKALKQTYADRRIEAERRGSDVPNTSGHERLARLLVGMAEHGGHQHSADREVTLVIPLSYEVLGQLICAAPRTAQRGMGTLKRRGLVTRNRKEIILHDLAQLRSIAKLGNS